MITSNTTITHLHGSEITSALFVIIFSAAFGLIARLVFPPRSCGPVVRSLVSKSLQSSLDLLPLSLQSVFGPSVEQRLTDLDNTRQPLLAKSLKSTIRELSSVYTAYSREFTYAHIPPSAYGPIVKALQNINQNPLLGPTSHVPGKRIQTALERTYGISTPASPVSHKKGDDLELHGRHRARTPRSQRGHRRSASLSPSPRPVLLGASHEVVAAISTAMASAIADVQRSHDGHLDVESKPTSEARVELEAALGNHQLKLASLLDDLGRTSHQDRDHFRLAFYLTALLDLAKDVLELMVLISAMSARTGPRRLYVPHSNPFGINASEKQQNDREGETERDEADTGDEDLERFSMNFAAASKHRTHYSHREDRASRVWRAVWDDPRVLGARVSLSHFIHSAQGSAHVKFAIKLAGGMSLLALPAFLPVHSPGSEWFADYRMAWGVVSYLFVLELHTGATFKIGTYRLAGTFIGAVAAYVVSSCGYNAGPS